MRMRPASDREGRLRGGGAGVVAGEASPGLPLRCGAAVYCDAWIVPIASAGRLLRHASDRPHNRTCFHVGTRLLDQWSPAPLGAESAPVADDRFHVRDTADRAIGMATREVPASSLRRFRIRTANFGGVSEPHDRFDQGAGFPRVTSAWLLVSESTSVGRAKPTSRS